MSSVVFFCIFCIKTHKQSQIRIFRYLVEKLFLLQGLFQLSIKTLKYVNFRFIMNSNLKTEQKQNFPELEDETKESKTFIQDSFKVDYMNTSKIFYLNSPNSADVKVNNYLCYQQGQNLYKITEIIYEGKLIRIEDKFEVTMNGGNLCEWSSVVDEKIKKEDKKCSRNIQKVRMFNKNSNKSSKVQKRDKKNIVKNVVKIFLSWLQEKQESNVQMEQTSALHELRKLMRTQNYNNRLIKKMIENNCISKAFLIFLEDRAEQQIKYSRIQDKESHYQALQIYKSLLLKIQKQPYNSHQNQLSSHNQQDQSSQQNSFDKNSSNNRPKPQQNNLNINQIKAKRQVNQYQVSIERQKDQKSRTQDSNTKNKIILIHNVCSSTTN